MPEQRDVPNMGGTMRLGLYPCKLLPGSRAQQAYGEEVVYERHRHRFEFNNEYREVLAEAGLVYNGLSPHGRVVHAIRAPHPPRFAASPFRPPGSSPPLQAEPP